MSLHPMPRSTDRQNVHPVDRMGEIKEQIAALETEFAELREKVISEKCSNVGNQWLALVTEAVVRRINLGRAEKALSTALFNSLVDRHTQTRVTLKRVTGADDEE